MFAKIESGLTLGDCCQVLHNVYVGNFAKALYLNPNIFVLLRSAKVCTSD
jgi:hypothetical protein